MKEPDRGFGAVSMLVLLQGANPCWEYNTRMTADTFREILKRTPFEPFRVVMSSGESYNVMHPEMVLVSAKALVLAVSDPAYSDGERLAFCSYLHIAHVETLKPSRAA